LRASASPCCSTVGAAGELIACDNPYANRLTIQILAAVAEVEARRISERTKVALAAYKVRGGILGATRPESRNLSIEARKRGAGASAVRRGALMVEAYEDLASRMHALRSSRQSLRANRSGAQ
jgi:DNA invertase Pin-like site-specific DNA recombinase